MGHPAPSTVWPVAWSATEAIRAFTKLKKYSEGEELFHWLREQFSGRGDERTRKALAWAVVERSKAPYAEGYFAEALRIIESGISYVQAANSNGILDLPLAWAMAQRALYLRRMGKLDSGLAACDEIIGLYESHEDDNILAEVAWTMLEKAVCLRRAKCLRASILEAQRVQENFAETLNPRIVKQRIWAIHTEGDALLCEAKMQMINGLAQDAREKLKEAVALFNKASSQDPNCPWHLACSSYAHFLSGDIDQAKSEFKGAMAVGPFDWQGAEHDEWSEESMFPVAQDHEFVKLRQRWTKEFEHGRNQRTRGRR